MSDHERFVRFDTDTNAFVARRLRITFTNFGQSRVKFDDSGEYWSDFVNKWWYHRDYKDTPLVLTTDQQSRLDEVNAQGITAAYLSEVAEYVRWGVVADNTDEPYLASLVGTQTVTEAGLEKQRYERCQELAAHRYEVEVGGATLDNGTVVPTDRESQSQLGNAYNTLKDGHTNMIDWKGPDGWEYVTVTEVTAMATASSTHVQRCFTAERHVDEDLTAETDETTLMEYDVVAAFNAELTALNAG